MTVAKLINKLSKMPKKSEVKIVFSRLNNECKSESVNCEIDSIWNKRYTSEIIINCSEETL